MGINFLFIGFGEVRGREIGCAKMACEAAERLFGVLFGFGACEAASGGGDCHADYRHVAPR